MCKANVSLGRVFDLQNQLSGCILDALAEYDSEDDSANEEQGAKTDGPVLGRADKATPKVPAKATHTVSEPSTEPEPDAPQSHPKPNLQPLVRPLLHRQPQLTQAY